MQYTLVAPGKLFTGAGVATNSGRQRKGGGGGGVSKMSQFALNMRIVKIVSKLSLQGIKTVITQVNLRQF